MRRRFDSDDLAPGGLGLLALALGAGAILGIVRPGEQGVGSNVPALAFIGLLAGVIALYIGKTRGPGRQLAIVGCGVALLSVAMYGGLVALDALMGAV